MSSHVSNAAEAEQSGAAEATSGTAETVKRRMSTIVFPYGDLEDGEAVARAVWNHGRRCDLNQLAATLGHGKPTSGAFRIKLSTARIFGLVGGTNQAVTLTDLGQRIANEGTADAARAEAFLNVPLYHRIFDEVSPAGGHLPEDAGLEDMIKRLGVVETQADRARQAFQRSVRQAGFNQHGERRLVRPAIARMDAGTAPEGTEDGGGDSGQAGRELGMKPPLVTEFFRQLPDDGKQFPAADRERWEKAFKATLDLIYGPASTTGGASAGSNGATSAGSDAREAPPHA